MYLPMTGPDAATCPLPLVSAMQSQNDEVGTRACLNSDNRVLFVKTTLLYDRVQLFKAERCLSAQTCHSDRLVHANSSLLTVVSLTETHATVCRLDFMARASLFQALSHRHISISLGMQVQT